MVPDPLGSCYVDTSALIKRYVAEPGSDEFDAFCERADLHAVISPLGLTEFASAVRRKGRLGDMTGKQQSTVRKRFLDDIAAGGWQVVEFDPIFFDAARTIIEEGGTPLSTLDALHLACALGHGLSQFATADRQLAAAARKAKLRVHLF